MEDFLCGIIIGRLECGCTQLEVSEELGIAQSVISRLWQRIHDDGLVCSLILAGLLYGERQVTVTTKRTPLNDTITVVQDGSLRGGIVFGFRTDLHVQSVTMTGHINRDVILEQHVCLFRGAMGAEFLFMDDNGRPHRANIVDECLKS
ncbi:cubilin [Trichonephila clavipes]|uniref:Cubilin n=1 Tax=Trichonephila clavipes TaxID=2585209 RepID=A0A8X6VM67_TRICX|nr:cubilin [Trichonephila clavipes]